MPCFYCPTRKLRVLPAESLIKAIGLSYHIYRELYDGLYVDSQDHMLHMGLENAHHVCMISGFLVTSIIEILIYYGVPLPYKTEYFFNLLSALIQLLIMSGHKSAGVENTLHELWTILIGLTFVAGCCEIYDPDNLWAIYMRICFFLTQGSWLMQIAFVLWPHTANPRFTWTDSHATHVWLNIYLMVHLAAAACTLMIQYLFVYYTIGIFDRCYTRYELDLSIDDAAAQIKFNDFENRGGKEYSILLNNEDEDSLDNQS